MMKNLERTAQEDDMCWGLVKQKNLHEKETYPTYCKDG